MSRFQITVPELHHYRLRAWAYLKVTNRATLAVNIVQASIEANWTDVDQGLNDLAELKGMTRAELNEEIEKGE
jgi:hypothetical protein